MTGPPATIFRRRAALLLAALAVLGCRLGDLVSTPAASPAVPVGLAQLKSDGATAIARGATTDEPAVTFTASVSDLDAKDQVTLEVEVRPVGVPFSDAATAAGTPVASGAVASIPVSGLAENTAYHWQARAVDETGRASSWVPFGTNAETDGDFTVAVPETPAAPASLAQLKSDGITALALGATTDETTVIVRATVTDPDPGDTLRLQVERQPVGAPFTQAASATSTSAVTSGNLATVTLTGLADNTSYHWQARAVDQTGRASAWMPFGANAEDAADFQVNTIAEPPGQPVSLAQLKSDGTTTIPVGGTTDEATVVFQATLSDPDPGDSLRLQIERLPVGTQFTGTPSATSEAVTSGGTARVAVGGHLENVSYHWQARAIDRTGITGPWVSFGDNPENQADYRIDAPETPAAPTALGQFRQNGQTAIAVGGTTDQTTVVFKATITDPDPSDQVRLELELRKVGEDFTGTATAASALVASGTTADISVSALSTGNFHWQVRTVDQTGRASPWVPFGNNLESETDFTVQ